MNDVYMTAYKALYVLKGTGKGLEYACDSVRRPIKGLFLNRQLYRIVCRPKSMGFILSFEITSKKIPDKMLKSYRGFQ